MWILKHFLNKIGFISILSLRGWWYIETGNSHRLAHSEAPTEAGLSWDWSQKLETLFRSWMWIAGARFLGPPPLWEAGAKSWTWCLNIRFVPTPSWSPHHASPQALHCALYMSCGLHEDFFPTGWMKCARSLVREHTVSEPLQRERTLWWTIVCGGIRYWVLVPDLSVKSWCWW